jgi:adenosylhomocysteine nucleosidase
VTSPPTDDVLFVVGMRREAQILGRGRRVLVGADRLADAMATQPPSAVISFGLCGALGRSLRCGDLVLATEVIDAETELAADEALLSRFSAMFPRAVSGRVLGSDAIVGDPARKAALATSTGAIAVDMESHLVARVAARAGVAFAVVRCVSDRAADALPHAAQAGFRPDGRIDVIAVLAALGRRPWETPGLIATARGAGAGFRALRDTARALSL